MSVLVVGYGMAGARLAAELHARDRYLPVTAIGAEPHRAYNRILLSGVLAGKLAEPEVTLAEPAGRGVALRLGVTVTAIDRAARTLSTSDGDRIPYEHLVLATGSHAVLPPIDGLAEPLPDRVAVFRTLDDCRRILATADKSASALVLGGGLLGLEAARGLALRGLRVDVVHAVGHLMERQLDPAASAVLVGTLAGLGVTVHLGAATTRVSCDSGGVTAALADGRHLVADLAVVACGTRPETALARTAGLTVERGIVVDDRLRTSDPAIFAIGDCAQHAGVVGGLVAPAWEQARVVADVVTGTASRYRPPAPVTRLKATGIDLAALMPDAATVCQCNAVTKRALLAAWRGGARSAPEVVAATRATTGCGSCADAVHGLVEWLSNQEDPA